MINVTVIGFGYVGTSLSFLLLNSKHAIRLNIMDPNPNREGAFLDVSHGNPLYYAKELYLNNEELLLNADFIYYAAGTPNTHGASRLSTAKENIELSKSIFNERTLINTPYIIVITNPVDVITYSVLQFNDLPPERIIGTGTFLDSTRLSYYLSHLSNLNTTDFETVVLGEHGDSQVPVFSMCKANGKPILSHPKFTRQDLEKAGILTKNAAFQIRETQEGTTYGVAKCAATLLDYLLGEGEHSLTLSMLTNDYYRSLLLLDEDIYIGMPVTIKNGTVRVNNQINLLDEELDAYRKSADILSKTLMAFSIK